MREKANRHININSWFLCVQAINHEIFDGLKKETADGRRFSVTRHDDNVCDYKRQRHDDDTLNLGSYYSY